MPPAEPEHRDHHRTSAASSLRALSDDSQVRLRALAVDARQATCDASIVRELAVSALVLLIALGVPLGAYHWARRLAHRPCATRPVVILPHIVVAVAALNLVVAGVRAAVVVCDWDGDPSERATTLAKGISAAMNSYALGLAVLLAIAVILVPVTVLGRR